MKPKANISVLAKLASKWISSEAGIEAQKEATRRSTEVLNKLREDQRVAPEVLSEPITI